MEILDAFGIFAPDIVGWFIDKIEDSFGRTAAWLGSLASGLGLIGILVWILVRILSR